MAISTWGTGRKDFSQNVEYTVQPIIRSHLLRSAWTFSTAAYSLDWTWIYMTILYIGSNDTEQGIIDEYVRRYNDPATAAVYASYYEPKPDHVNQYTVETNANYLIELAFYEFDNFSHFLDNYESYGDFTGTNLGTTIGYEKAQINWTNAVVMYEKTYGICFNVVMEHPYPSYWPADIFYIIGNLHGLEEEVVYG